MFCGNCGTDVGDYTFCPNCGTQVRDQAPYEEAAPPPQPTIIINNVSNDADMDAMGYDEGESYKSRLITLILCVFFGYIGLHRFYVGKTGTGILYIFTAGLFLIGWIVDIVSIVSGTFRDGGGYLILT